jgi:hypothetical protein
MIWTSTMTTYLVVVTIVIILLTLWGLIYKGK